MREDGAKVSEGRLRGWSLRRKVPLYIFGGLAILLASWTWFSYTNVREAALAIAQERLTTLTSEFATSYSTSLRGSSGSSAVSNDSLVRFLQGGDLDSRQAAVALLERTAGPRQQIVRRADLFALDGTPVLSIPRDSALTTLERHEELAPEFRRVIAGPLRVVVGRLRLLDGQVVMPVIAAVVRDSQPVGVVVMWRRLTASPAALERLSKLVGASAHVYIGNDRGDVWTDFSRQVEAPPLEVPVSGELQRYARPDQPRVVAAARVIEGTPWSLLVEMAEDSVMAPASQFLRRSTTSGIIVLLIATAVGWFVSRRLTTPLHELSEAAGALAAGDYSRAVPVRRGDELGQLAAAFNTMAARVGDAHHVLEGKVRERTAQLQERNDDLEAFAHSISHDLRAPLRSMHGFSQALLEDNADQLDATGKDYARRIATSAGRMDALIQDLLTYSRVSRAQISLTRTDLTAVSHAAVSQLEADVTARQAVVTVHEPLPPVIAQRAVLEQIVANLVANALKFVAPGKRPEVHIRAEPGADGRVRLWVEDNGIGIDNVHHQRIFSVFERLHSNEEFAGTGIGLAIVRKGAERLGGHAGVESTLGRGSRFWIELQHAEN